MANWNQALWHLRQSWLFVRHAYRCGWGYYNSITDSWSHRRHAMAYAVVQVTPRTRISPRRY